MASGPEERVPFRRRREQRTDYRKRLQLLKSGTPRAVVRHANNHTRVQVVSYNPDGDAVETAASSEQLDEYGWDHHTGNLAAAYLTGFLAGKQAQAAGIDAVIPDLGPRRQQDESRAYAAVRGMRDAGISLDAGENVLPDEERAHGGHADAYESSGIRSAVDSVKDAIAEAV